MSENKPDPASQNTPGFQWKKTLIFWILLIFIVISVPQIFRSNQSKEVDIKYSELKRYIQNHMLEDVVIIEDEFHGTLKFEETRQEDGREVKYKKIKTILPEKHEKLAEQLEAQEIPFDYKKKSLEWWNYVLNPLTMLILFVFLTFILIRRLQGGAGPKGVFNFGKSRARLLTENLSKVTFRDVAGADEAKQELEEIIEFLKSPEKFQVLGGRIPKGVLLLGPPGTGKTLLARAVAGEAGVPFFSISGADFVEMFVGVGASRVRDLFDQGKRNAPCIIFIDEIDAVGRHRGAGLGGGHDEREQTLNQLLVEMDGFETNEGVILLAATNRPDVLDRALLRPGRFDRQVVVDRPDVRGREGILKVHTRKSPIAEDVILEVLAKGTPGFSGADLANMVNEAALLAARRNKKRVEMTDLEEAKDKIMMGVERKSMIITEEEKRNTAYHESGHVLVSRFVPGSDPVHKVTIIPRGRALGVTAFLPIDEKHNYTKAYCESIMTHLLGGRAAEFIVLNQLTTGAGNDIERASELARKMVCEWGMSDLIGPISMGKKSEEIFLGREIAQHRDYSEQTAILIDKEVKRIVEDAAKKAHKIIREHLPLLHALAEALLEREILDAEEIQLIMQGKTLPPKKKNNTAAADEKKPKPKPRTRKKKQTDLTI
ncbi:ATP-dependent zinc metalloprotease FtsH [bacterium]|nr:ATP-dependent zinc metalloprotease FtsH [bacterium]